MFHGSTGKDSRLKQMEAIREQQERLAKLHFDVGAEQVCQYSHSTSYFSAFFFMTLALPSTLLCILPCLSSSDVLYHKPYKHFASSFQYLPPWALNFLSFLICFLLLYL